MNQTRPVVFLVVGAIAFVLVAYVTTLSIATLYNMTPDPKVLEYLQAAGIFAAGSLASLLAQTRGTNTTDPSSPATPVTVVNPPSDPANVVEHKPKP